MIYCQGDKNIITVLSPQGRSQKHPETPAAISQAQKHNLCLTVFDIFRLSKRGRFKTYLLVVQLYFLIFTVGCELN